MACTTPLVAKMSGWVSRALLESSPEDTFFKNSE